MIGGGIVVAVVAAIAWVAWQTANGNQTGKAISRLSTGDFHSLAFSPTDPNTIFFGHHGGLMVSRNGGKDWQPTSLQNTDAMAVAVPSANPQIVYAAGHGVLVKSTDGGQTWSPLSHNLPGTDIHGFAVDPEDANKVFAHVVGQAGLMVSNDGGTTWVSMSGALPVTAFNLATGATGNILYAAAGEAGVWQSTDGGQTWAQLAGVPGDGAIAIAYNRANKRLLITTLGNEAGLYGSDDSGQSWKSLGLTGIFMAVASSPTDPNRLIVVDEEGWVYASRDGGSTWSDSQ